MLDAQLIFAEGQDASAAFTSKALDFRQPHPNLGGRPSPLVLIFAFPTALAGDGTLTLDLQDSADGTDFASVVQLPLTADKVASAEGDVVLQLPLRHRRYLRVVGAVDGTVTGAVTAYIGDAYEHLPQDKKEGLDPIAGADVPATVSATDALVAAQAAKSAADAAQGTANDAKSAADAAQQTADGKLDKTAKAESAKSADALAAAAKVNLGTQVSGTLGTANGGTGNGTGKAPTAGTADTANGLGASVKVNLATQVTGTLAVANGGTGKTTA